MQLDHVVLWVEDPLRSVSFYVDVVGLTALRVDEFSEGRAPFPSVRVSPHSIIDLMPRRNATGLNAMPGAEGSAGHLVNHVCFAMSAEEYRALRGRVTAAGAGPLLVMTSSFGAQGLAPETFYFRDPDGNVLEARAY